MDFRLLGPLEVHENGESLRLGSPKQRALLALLLLRTNEVVSRDVAIDALWPEDPPERAVEALQVYVHGLRKAVGRERIALRGNGYALRVERGELDLERAERLFTRGQAALAADNAGAAAEHFRTALELWHGEPLADVAIESAERARLSELRLRVLELDAEARLVLGRHEDLVPELEGLVAEHPLRETFSRQLMLALYRAGRQADALDVFRTTRTLLRDELGLAPSPALAELERAILRQDPSLQAVARRAKLQLPTPATAFVGRNLDVAAVCAELRGETRLLTLTGPGGIGKTRLAIEAATELGAELDDGAFFVDLAPTAEPENVAATIAATVVVAEAEGRSTLDAVTARLRPLEAVLVLDNFERLLDAAPVVAHLVEHAPRLRVLITSRAPLHLAPERELNVPPLDVLEDAIAIFVARAQAADSVFRLTGENAATVAQICRALEGLPLALELAAARIRILTPEQLLHRLEKPLAVLTGGDRDVPARQQTLRATIDWSYELLDEEAKRLLGGLAVFAGGCTLQAAEVVCDAQLDALSALLDSNLLRREQPSTRAPRFRMLDTVREYALELQTGDARRKHAWYFTELADRVGADLVGPRRIAAAHELAVEHENLRAALAYSREHDLTLGFRIASALRSYWATAERGNEIRVWLEHAFSGGGPVETTPEIGALLVLGRQQMNAGRYEPARATLERCVGAARASGCWSVAAGALGYLAWLSAAAHDDDGCAHFAGEAVELARRAGDRWAERQGLAMVAAPLINRGDYAAAITHLDRSLELARELDDPSTTVLALVNSSYGAVASGNLARARPQLEEALDLCHQLDEPSSTVSVLQLLAWEASLSGERARARTFLREALELLSSGGRHSQLVDVLSEAALELETSDPETAAKILSAAEARPTARGIPATERYGPLSERLAGTTRGQPPVTLEEAVAEALRALG